MRFTALLVAFTCLSAPANAQIINFSDTTEDYFVANVASSGFTFTPNSPSNMAATDSPNWSGDGKFLLLWQHDGGNTPSMNMVKNDGSAFHLSSFDFGGYANASRLASSSSVFPTSVSVEGLVGGNVVASKTFTLGTDYQAHQLTNLKLDSAFTSLSSARFTTKGTNARGTFDNINLSAHSAVPEPSSAIALATCLGGVLLRRRRAA